MEKFFYKRISNYIKTCSTTPNTGKFARVKGWAKKHKCSIAFIIYYYSHLRFLQVIFYPFFSFMVYFLMFIFFPF